MAKKPRRWKRGDKFSASHLNEAGDVARKLYSIRGKGVTIKQGLGGTTLSVPKRPNYIDIRRGIVVNRGPDVACDHFDERYFVKPAFSLVGGVRDAEVFQADQPPWVRTPSGSSDSTAASAGDVVDVYPFTVTNIVEQPFHTHLLRTDGSKWVTIFGFSNLQTGVMQYHMFEQPDSLLGITQVTGPCGEADFTDNRYWVALQKVTNDQAYTAKCAALTLAGLQLPDPGDTSCSAGGCSTPAWSGYTGSSASAYAAHYMSRVACVHNFSEKECSTHLLKPGTPVKVEFSLDASTPNRKIRYWMKEGDFRIPLFVYLTSDGGSGGTQTSPATWTYTVDTPWQPASTHLLTLASPLRPRGNGIRTAASMGYAGCVGGAMVLLEAWEPRGTTACPSGL